MRSRHPHVWWLLDHFPDLFLMTLIVLLIVYAAVALGG